MKELINSPSVTIVDVRSAEEFAMGNVSGSINIPLGEVPNNVEAIENMSKPLILCCASGNRSGQAIAYLQQYGIEDMHNGGGWQEVQAYK